MKTIVKASVVIAFVILAVLSVHGCALVQPYEREWLADPLMQFDYDDLDAAYLAKMLETREGSAGGQGGASGGCGCK
ncbi:DUF4266 domain-containing protein [bacterium]|nr:DUF4266 domain-containing protein [bacterium]